jgi:hypothetical protein
MPQPGRPRLDSNPAFREGFATILPRLNAGLISQCRAARELRISVRSLKRYVEKASANEGLSLI